MQDGHRILNVLPISTLFEGYTLVNPKLPRADADAGLVAILAVEPTP